MRLIFVAGPYRDSRGSFFVDQNIQAARQVAAEWWQRGWAVLTPHANTAMMDGLMPDGAFLEGALEMLRRCDALVLLPSWRESAGAVAELKLARELCLPIYYRDWNNAWVCEGPDGILRSVEEPRPPGREEML